MSIKLSINELTDQQREMILKDLQFENSKNKKWIHSFDIDEDTDEIYLPYAYAREKLNKNTKSRQSYPSVEYNFIGQLRDYQKEVRTETIKELNKKGSCVLSLHVGWGKSMLSVYLATKLKFKTLIIVNRLILIKQWKELISSVCPDSKYQIVKTKQKMDKECDFYLINALNVPKMGRGYFDDIGTCIMDEIHLLCAEKLYRALFHVMPKYAIALSATPTRPDGLDVLIDLFFGKYKIIKPLSRKHTVYTIRTGIKIKYELTWDGKMDWNSVLNNQGDHPKRNKIIIDIITKFSDRYFLILCKRINQGKKLVCMLNNENEYVTDLLGSKKEFDPNARIIVATTQKCGVGFSHDKLDALLLASDMEEYFIQYLGRVFRTPDVEPIIFDLVDDLPVLNRHYQTRKRVYRKAGGNIQEIGDIKLL